MLDNYGHNGLEFIFQLSVLLCIIYYYLLRGSFVVSFRWGCNCNSTIRGGIDHNNESDGEAVCGKGDRIVWYTDKLWEYRLELVLGPLA